MSKELQQQELMRREAESLLQRANGIIVNSKEADEVASAFCVEAAERVKKYEGFFEKNIALARAALRGLQDTLKSLTDPVEQARKVVKGKIADYRTEQERLRREEERRRSEEAQKRREADAVELAAALEKAGKGEAAEKLVEQVIAAPAPMIHVPSQVAKGTGVTIRTVWKFRIVDASAVPREWLMVDEVKVGRAVRESKGATVIPGIENYSEKV